MIMSDSRTKIFIALLVLVFAHQVSAEVSIDELIEEARVREGAIAIRDFDGWRPPQKIVIRGAEYFVAALQAEFPEVQLVRAGVADERLQQVTDADAIVGFCDADAITAATHLVWVQVGSAGVERCFEAGAIASGDVMLTNMQKMSSPAIGEHAIAMMLSLTRGLVYHTRIMPDGQWNRGVGSEIGMMSVDGKTVLVVGLGGIGTAAAKRASALGMHVLATRNSSRSGPEFVDYVGLSGELHELAAQADVVINALPLTPATEGIFDDAFFDAAKPGMFFINVARGRSVVTDDLVAALQDGRVAGAGLDVTDPEPLPSDHPLWQIPNVVITPHIAWYGSDGERHRALERENIRRFIAGDALLNVVDPEKRY
jgi:phosphoglycerate dehydrogenase-like enzyme